MKIYLLRHAKPIVVDGDFYRCHLAPEGIQETRTLAQRLPTPDIIISSPWVRARETAEILSECCGSPIVIDNHFGEWSLQSLNLPFEPYDTQEAAGWENPSLRVLGGESLVDVRERALQGLDSLRKYGASSIIVVAHGTIIDLLCASITGRRAVREDIQQMKHLAYATLVYERVWNVEKDII